MQVTIPNQTKYPRFSEYVKFSLPKLITVPKIVRNVASYGGLTHTEFKTAISWGSGPTITVTDLSHGQCGGVSAYGCFRSTKPTFIEIDAGTVSDFEKLIKSAVDKNKTGKAVYVLGASLLHELCHWGNYNNIPRIPELIDMGTEFEKLTYGKIIY